MERHSRSAPLRGQPSHPPSEELLHRAKAGDDSALDQLFARYVPRLHRWAHGRVPTWARNAAETADYVQDTVLHTLRNIGGFHPQREGALLGYLRRSLVNRMRDQFRYASRHQAPDDLDDSIVDGGQSPLELTITSEDRQRYEAGLKKLRRADRQAILASIELGYSYEQIALVLNKPSAEAARLAVRRALLRLGEEMARGT
jgi:RNA polymerase sigma factor (sigma-70 family)